MILGKREGVIRIIGNNYIVTYKKITFHWYIDATFSFKKWNMIFNSITFK